MKSVFPPDLEGDNNPEETGGSHADPMRQRAIVVGIGEYSSPISHLDFAPDDARAVANCLTGDYGFEVSLLLDAQASLATLQQVITQQLEQSDGSTRWLLYFAGHGTVVEQTGYLLPTDAQLNNTATYLLLPWLLEKCHASDCAEILILLDACYAGRALMRPDDLSDMIPVGLQGEHVRQIITSGNPDQPVLDGGGSGHSVFTQALLDALEGWAGIHNNDGSIRFTRLLDHLVFEVPGRLRRLGLSAASQQPIGGNLSGNRWRRDFILQSTAPRLSPEIVLDTNSEDPRRRLDGLACLVTEAEAHPEQYGLAVQLALHHLHPAFRSRTLVTPTLRFESVPEVRAQAAACLGALKDTSVVEPLTAALDDTPQVVRAAAHALGQIADPRVAPVLFSHLQICSDELMLDLLGAIGAVGDLDVIIESLGEALRRDRLIPFVGPDWPQELTGLPDRRTLAGKLAERAGLNTSDSLASTAALTMKNGNRFVFTDFMRRALDDRLARPTEIYQALAKLNVKFWLSGAYDDLLIKALNANSIAVGSDTQYRQPDPPTVVRLAGSLKDMRGLVVVESDYEQLRENEADRRLLISYLQDELQGKAILFIGHDPNTADFGLLQRYILNVHLVTAATCAFLVWPDKVPSLVWSGQPFHHIALQPKEFLARLLAASQPSGPL
jgi:hypothetical protein